MSLEQALAENTAAVLKLTEVLLSKAQGKKETAVVEKPLGATSATAQVALPVEKPAEKQAELTYEGLKQPFLNLVKAKGRDFAIGVIKPFASLKEIEGKPEHYATVLAAITKASS